MGGGMVGDEGVGAEGAHEILEAGDIGATGRKDQACVEQLSVKLLCFFEVMGGTVQPLFDRRAVFSFFGTCDGDGAFR